MKKLALTLFSFLIVGSVYCQVATIKSQRIRINEYGQVTNISSFDPSEIIINAESGAIEVQTNISEAQQYIDYKTSFRVVGSKGSRGGTQLFVSEDFIFTINYRTRTVMVSKKNTDPNISALWFEETTF